MAKKTWTAATFAVEQQGCERRDVTVYGRARSALETLIAAGAAGCTAIDTPGPRWSDYVHKLRQMRVPIETIREMHGEPFPGTHARYRLTAKVTRIEEVA